MLPSLLALLGSALTSAGACCALTFVFCIAWGDPAAHPIALPISIAGSLGCLYLFFLVSCFYFRLCKIGRRNRLMLLDLAVYALSLFPFFHLWSMVAWYLSNGGS